jgi:hypothetical protein
VMQQNVDNIQDCTWNRFAHKNSLQYHCILEGCQHP